MERLPPDAFGRTLRALIREVWKSQAAFACAISLDTTWISKVIRGEQGGLTYASLEKLLAGFSRATDKERLYEAWLEVYAPSPLDQGLPDIHSPGDVQIAYARSVHERISSGQVLQTHRVLLELWNGVVKTRGREDVKIEVGHALVDTANQLDRIQLSLAVSAELCRTAKESGEPEWIATALWVRGVGARLCRPRQIDAAEGALKDLAAFTAGWNPGSAKGKALQHTFLGICARELTLSGLDAVRSKLTGCDSLRPRIEALERWLSGSDNGIDIGLGSEVIARAHVASGNLDEADRCLARAAKLATTRTNELKVMIGRVQLLVAAGERGRAGTILAEAVEIADQYRLVHHRQKLAGLTQRLYGSPASAI